jgi:hypothetical protein
VHPRTLYYCFHGTEVEVAFEVQSPVLVRSQACAKECESNQLSIATHPRNTHVCNYEVAAGKPRSICAGHSVSIPASSCCGVSMPAPTTHASSARVLTLSLPPCDCCAVALQALLSMPALRAGASDCCLHRQPLQCTSSSAATDGAHPQLQPSCGHPGSSRLAEAVFLQVRYELGLQVQLISARSTPQAGSMRRLCHCCREENALCYPVLQRQRNSSALKDSGAGGR